MAAAPEKAPARPQNRRTTTKKRKTRALCP
jgi:hypothetical protein